MVYNNTSRGLAIAPYNVVLKIVVLFSTTGILAVDAVC